MKTIYLDHCRRCGVDVPRYRKPPLGADKLGRDLCLDCFDTAATRYLERANRRFYAGLGLILLAAIAVACWVGCNTPKQKTLADEPYRPQSVAELDDAVNRGMDCIRIAGVYECY